MSVDAQEFRNALSRWATGVTVVTTQLDDGRLHGMTASSFSSVSLDPLLVLICVKKTVYAHQCIVESHKFAVNILNTTQVDWGKRFAGMFPEIQNRFEGIAYTTAVTGSPILPDVLGWVDCTLYQTYDGGDHSIFIGQVQAAGSTDNADPLMYFNRMWGKFTPEN
ncbi:MAG: flavin reductase family protein [Anaerolineae bacterium]